MSSLDFTRISPIRFHTRPAEVERRGDWEIVLAFEDEGEGPWLVDLSHRPKWDLQHENLDSIKPLGVVIPPAPGQCAAAGGWLVNRMNRTQSSLWHLGVDAQLPHADVFVTETTNGLCLLALVGRESFAIMEKLSPLDLATPDRTAPFLVQGPVLHIPSQVVVLSKADPATILLAFSRGYGQAMAEAILDAGREFGLRPGGEKRTKV